MNNNGKGPLIGVIIVIIILVIGAIYFWQFKAAEAPAEPENPSDEVQDIEADLQMFNTTGFDAELQDINNEFNQPN